MLRKIYDLLPAGLQAGLRRRRTQIAHSRLINALPHDLEQPIARLQACAESQQPNPESQRPVFILSSGWRSGSTLLQRLVSSSGDTLIWGEPYDRMSYVQTMASSLLAIEDEYPKPWHFLKHTGQTDLSNQWIANLYPDLKDLLNAHRAFFNTLYEQPASEAGFSHWGFKEVRLTAAHARYLRLLYPHARILLLTRDPFDAWQSYRKSADFYYAWPDRQITTAEAFGTLWADAVEGFVEHAKSLDALFIRYEDLVLDNSMIDTLQKYLGYQIDVTVLDNKISGSFSQSRTIPQTELNDLQKAVAPARKLAGYE